MELTHEILLKLELPLLLQLSGLTFAVFIDSNISRKQRRILLLIVLLVLTLLVQNLINPPPEMRFEKIAASVYGYCVRPVILVLFLQLVCIDKKLVVAWSLIAVNTVIHLTAFFSKIAFGFHSNGVFFRGPLGFTCHVISFVLLIFCLIQVIAKNTIEKKKEALIPFFCVLMLILATLADIKFYKESRMCFLYITIVSCSMMFYIWLHLQFVRQHERALLAEQRIQIMMSQIQPHFLYNTLSTIQALCLEDPEKAFETLGQFGQYLRQNLDALEQPDMISFEKELSHSKIYAEIEMIRFPSIHVTYDVQDSDFYLPALTVQPLVENAVRHGVRKRKEGKISVSTRLEEDAHVIVIEDNGSGFNPDQTEKTDGTHIGIRNVRERLREMCGGTLHIRSVIGEGTTVTIRIPCDQDRKE